MSSGIVPFAAIFLTIALTAGIENVWNPGDTEGRWTEPVRIGAQPGAAATLFQFLGGLRSAAADAAWLRATSSWASGYASRVEPEIRLAISLRPERLHFWREGAETIAYDLPRMTISALERQHGIGGVPRAVARRIREEHARRAVGILESAIEQFPGSRELQTALGRICLGPLDSPEQVAPWFRLSAFQEGFSEGQIYLRILEDAGRYTEAINFIDAWLPTLEDPRNRARIPLIEAWREQLIGKIN